jgi:hypothetical protein
VLFKLLRTNSGFYYQRTDFSLTGAVAFYAGISRRRKFIYATSLDECVEKRRYSKINFLKNGNPVSDFLRWNDLLLVDRMVEYGKKKADLILCQSVYQQKELKKNFGLESRLLRNSYRPASAEEFPKENIILWIGNLRQAKQPEVFLRLVNETSLPGWQFRMIGMAGPEYRKKIDAVENKDFEYLGALSLQETEHWIKKAKVLVNTSKMEGFPNTFIQAWMFRTYVISLQTDPDGMLGNLQAGFYASGDINTLRKHLILISRHGPDTSILDNSLAHAREHFNLENNVSRLMNMMIELES